jgi:acyl-homoserine lactone acylase PvdQ
MKRAFLFLLLPVVTLNAQYVNEQESEVKKWKDQAVHVKIIRDNWGIAHVYGKTDADAVFGMLYTQCEDDFKRVERNYLTATGRLAEALGEEYIYHDLRMRLFQDSVMALESYKASPEWLKKLCNAFADGINFYLYTHPDEKPLLIKRFQPWMPFLFSEGSIGGDIETVSLQGLRDFYGPPKPTQEPVKQGEHKEEEPRGSNGFAIAPSRSANGNALFLINPHTTFYFRSEIHVNSEEGMNAYGAVTWGQFFIYQGFNEFCGWMHTSSEADAIDEYAETVGQKGNEFFYNYGSVVKLGTTANVSIKYRKADGFGYQDFRTFYTQHGPVVALRNGKMITVRLMREPIKALTQSFTRTKSKSFPDFERSMKLRTNSSNNTVYADADGNIAYWHGNFIPRRDPKFDWSKPVDGSDPVTEWKGLHTLDEMVHIKNPITGWIQNCNSTPFTVSGVASPNRNAYPKYMAPDEENPRGLHAIKVLENCNSVTLDKLIDMAYDSYLPAFGRLIPALIKGYDVSTNDSLRQAVAEPIQLLRNWNYRFSAGSVETTLGIYWATHLRRSVSKRMQGFDEQLSVIDFLANKTYEDEKLKALLLAMDELQRNFGTWKQPWGEINRFQRLHGNIDVSFDDAQPSLAVPFTSSNWGSLASFGARPYSNTKKMYGNSGNSFVAVVEFGKRVKAKSVMAGGASSNPASPNFTDQAPLYVQGQFKDVLFYYDDVIKNG